MGVEQVVTSVLASRKYRRVCPETVRRIAAEEWSARGALKSAVKATKARLHQAWGAYETPVDYVRAYDDLYAAYTHGRDDEVRIACRRLLSLHASTRERLPLLEGFYARIHAHTGVPLAVLDLACGLNPLTLPWMGLPAGASYHAYDIDVERVGFLARFLQVPGVSGEAHLQDVICTPPTQRADLALLLKSAPCLEQQRRGSTLAVLDALDVAHVVVSYPVRSLGRREKGMLAHYAHAFSQLCAERTWRVARLDFETELVFVVDKG
ncbi:MAG: Rmt family 16S rRNA (guanine(1405)-N(7))-methyltransferase [Anaerolineae bacterium]|nr:Rmt family 16S rRNA (guanine(1405)-N(7))-methyltransferase [Anaerolineae bacterium]